MSSDRASNRAAGGPKARFHEPPASPRPAAVSSTERTIVAAVPSSNGWARSTSGQAHSSPWRSRSRPLSAGESTTRGWVAEQSSWTRPGRVSSLLLAPPPIVVAASRTVTPTPARASVAAQARPFGPAPTTIALAHASLMDGEGKPVEPGLLPDHVGDPDVTLVDQPGRRHRRSGSAGARDCSAARPRGLRLEGHHAQLPLGEVAALLDRGQQPLVVEVAVAEVVAEDDAGDELALADVVFLDVVHRAGAEPVQGAAVASASSGTQGLCRGGRRSGPRS